MSLKEFGQGYSRLPQTGKKKKKKKDVVNVTKNMLFIISFLCINLKIIAVSLFLHKDLIQSATISHLVCVKEASVDVCILLLLMHQLLHLRKHFCYMSLLLLFFNSQCFHSGWFMHKLNMCIEACVGNCCNCWKRFNQFHCQASLTSLCIEFSQEFINSTES